MTPITAFSGKHVALFGLGGSGRITARALAEGGARVIAFDDNPETVEAADLDGIETADLHTANWSAFDALVLAPGVPLTHPKPHWTVDKARAHDLPIIGDIELFCQERAMIAPGAPFVAITGTNGKSTTTALIAHILRGAGRDVQMGGNIGVPVLALDPPAANRVHIVECSSFQIDLAPTLNPGIGILLNVSPDHLDRHGTMEHYGSIKKRLVAGADHAIVGIDDVWCRSAADEIEKAGVKVERISVLGARHTIDLSGADALRGDHNLQNALAASHACRALGLSDDEITQGLNTFDGLEHRMQIVARRGRVLFVNDSKATNVNAAAKALSSFRTIHWIAGGLAKEGGIASLSPLLSRVAKAYLIGEAAPAFAATLGERVPFEISATMDVAVRRAAADAVASDADEPVVLLAPAAASFDQYANFEKRGAAFIEAVNMLEPGHGRRDEPQPAAVEPEEPVAPREVAQEPQVMATMPTAVPLTIAEAPEQEPAPDAPSEPAATVEAAEPAPDPVPGEDLAATDGVPEVQPVEPGDAPAHVETHAETTADAQVEEPAAPEPDAPEPDAPEPVSDDADALADFADELERATVGGDRKKKHKGDGDVSS